MGSLVLFSVTDVLAPRIVHIMNVFTRTILLVAGLSLTAGSACSKSVKEDKSNTREGEVTATNKQGLAQETLLVLKFHHDK